MGLLVFRLLIFFKLLLQRKMGAKKGRIVRKIKFPTDIPAHFELGDSAADIQRRREEREQR